MKKKVIAGTTILALLVTMTTAFAGTGSTAFRIEIVVDTTIFVPTPCENGGSVTNTLEFQPGITGLDDPEAIAIDTCASDANGDWDIEMGGNVPLNLSFALNQAAPTGIVVSIANTCSSPFTAGNEVNLTTGASLPSWAQDLSDASVLEIWQRVAADTTASGDSSADLSIEVTSSYTP